MTQPASKVRALDEAIVEYVRPGMALHFGLAQARPNAAVRELIRQFGRTGARFTASASGFGGPQLGIFLMALGMLTRVTTGFVGEQYPTVGPTSRGKRLIDSGVVEMDDWSLLTLIQRLRAGAMGMEWAVTSSLDGSDLKKGSRDVRRVEDVTLVRALRPDITFLHGVVGDAAGNVVLSVPAGEGVLGAAAARHGAIVTVEEIVDRDTLSAAAGVPMVPGALVRAICPAPMGAHPAGLMAPVPFRAYSYADDYPFIAESGEALNLADEELDKWIDARLLRTPGEDVRRLLAAWDQPSPAAPAGPDTPPSAEETMAAVAARVLARVVKSDDAPRFILTGIGLSSLAAWLGRDLAGDFPPLISEVGLYDYVPQPGSPFLFNFPNLSTVAGLTDTEGILGILVQGQGEWSVGMLAAGQVDRFGNINSSRTRRGWLTGSGGANDIASQSRRNIVLIPHRPGRIVPEVDFVTSPGRYVTWIVTDRAVFERAADDAFTLVGVVGSPEDRLEDMVKDVVERTPWTCRVSRTVATIEPATAAERAVLASYDPERLML